MCNSPPSFSVDIHKSSRTRAPWLANSGSPETQLSCRASPLEISAPCSQPPLIPHILTWRGDNPAKRRASSAARKGEIFNSHPGWTEYQPLAELQCHRPRGPRRSQRESWRPVRLRTSKDQVPEPGQEADWALAPE